MQFTKPFTRSNAKNVSPANRPPLGELTNKKRDNHKVSNSTPKKTVSNSAAENLISVSPIVSKISTPSNHSGPSTDEEEEIQVENENNESDFGSDDDAEREKDEVNSPQDTTEIQQNGNKPVLSLAEQFKNCLEDFYGKDDPTFVALTENDSYKSLPEYLFGNFSNNLFYRNLNFSFKSRWRLSDVHFSRFSSKLNQSRF